MDELEHPLPTELAGRTTPENEFAMTCTFISKPEGIPGTVPLVLTPQEHTELHSLFQSGVAVGEMGRYVIECELGQGAMGRVYKAQDLRLQRAVAIKVIQPWLVEKGYDPGRFLRESRTTASLMHPAIATVFDHGTFGGKPFSVFEYLAGETLAEMMKRRGALPLDEVRLIIGPLAQALDLIHSRNIIHRDLKPENIRADEHGHFKVLDFGLARPYLDQADWRFCGTRNYASPEQAAELPCDGRSDQFTLAVIAFELLTGKRPCTHASVEDFEQKHPGCQPTNPQHFNWQLPDGVCSALVQALSSEPARRFVNCEEFASFLGCQFLSSTVEAPPIVKEVSCEKMWIRWLSLGGTSDSWIFPLYLTFSFMDRMQLAILALTRDSLWLWHRGMVTRWPIQAVTILKPWFRGRVVQLCADINGTKSKHAFRFLIRQFAEEWVDLFQQQKAEAPKTVDATSLTESRRVAILPMRPNVKLQVIGQVEAIESKRWRAEASLQVRAAVLGADAIVDTRSESIPSYDRSLKRIAGLAVRAIDDAARLQVRLRSLGNQLSWFATFTVAFLAVSIIQSVMMRSFAVLGTVRDPVADAYPWIRLLAISAYPLACLWPAFAAILLWMLKWPQLVRQSGLSVAAVGLIRIPLTLGAMAAVAIFVSGRAIWILLPLLISIVTPWSLFEFTFTYFLVRRALQIHRSYCESIIPLGYRQPSVRTLVAVSITIISVMHFVIVWLVAAATGFVGIWSAIPAAE